jgi:lactose/L-arabinose transport system substrate-binding protein
MLEVNNWDEYITSFVNGNVAGTINGCWILASVQTASDQSGKWAVTNIPRLDIEGATNYSANGGSSWGVTSNSKNPDLAKDFLAKTFAGSVPFYEIILPSSGALANYLPAAESDVYTQPQEFFAGQAIYADIVEYAGKIPSFAPGAYYYEARNAVATAVTNIAQGGNLDTELQAAHDELVFTIGL